MAEPLFKPQPRSTVKAIRHINYTCSPERYQHLERIAKRARITLKELLRQMVEHSLATLDPDAHPDARASASGDQ